MGRGTLPVRVSRRNTSRLAGTHSLGGDCRHSGASSSNGPGSMTAPDRACAPTAEPFSSTQMLVPGWSCLRRMAQARPAGPAPTTTTSYSITSRETLSVILFRSHPDGAIEADGLAVQHRDLEDRLHQRGKLLGLAEALREGNLPGERLLQLLGHRIHHRGVEDAGRDGHATDAEARQLPGDRQRHAGKPRFRG